MDLVTQFASQMIDSAAARMPIVKAPTVVDLQALIAQYGRERYRDGRLSWSDRTHEDYAEPADAGAIFTEVERLQGAEFELIDKARALIEAAERGFVGAELRLAIAGMRAAIGGTGSGL